MSAIHGHASPRCAADGVASRIEYGRALGGSRLAGRRKDGRNLAFAVQDASRLRTRMKQAQRARLNSASVGDSASKNSIWGTLEDERSIKQK